MENEGSRALSFLSFLSSLSSPPVRERALHDNTIPSIRKRGEGEGEEEEEGEELLRGRVPLG